MLPLSEVSLSSEEKSRINEQSYESHVKNGPIKCFHVFDDYRKLRKSLEEDHIYSLDRVGAAIAAINAGSYLFLFNFLFIV